MRRFLSTLAEMGFLVFLLGGLITLYLLLYSLFETS